MSELYTDGTHLVRLKTLDELPVPDWRQAAEEEHARRIDAEQGLERLRELLGEFVAKPSLFYGDGDCIYCGAYYSADMEPPYPHTPDCPVIRARAALDQATP